MKSSTRILGMVTATAAVLLVAVLVQPPIALSQQAPTTDQANPGHDQMPGMGQMPGMTQMHGQGTTPLAVTTPTMPGQDAFGAIQEIVRILEADFNTDWSKVNLEALRQHLIDMNEVTLKADASVTQIDGGLEVAVTGDGRTLAAIQRMIPAHAHEINGLNGWSAKADPLPNGELLTVTSSDPQEVQLIRGLGFIGLLVSGAHHQPHHLAIAKGEMVHTH